jgi:hypothetical protein
VANYATIGGWVSALNPVISAPLVMIDPQIIYGSTSLYPNLSYDQFYGISTAGSQGTALTGLEQFVPQLGAITPLTQALAQAKNVRYQEAQAKINKWHKEMFEDDDLTLSQALAGDCLWGAGFILANESDWEDLSYEDQEG